MSDRVWTAADFDYELPPELIAQTPTERRGESRLLVVDRSEPSAFSLQRSALNVQPSAFSHQRSAFNDVDFAAIVDLIPPGDLMIVNSTKVRHARLPATTPGGATAEVLLIHPSTDDTWIAMGRPGRAMQPGKHLILGEGVSVETLEVMSDGMRRVRFVGATAEAAIMQFGRLPLPPYIDRDPTAEDEQRYQTVYAQREGSVAAPTAGLHFTPELLETLRSRGVFIAELDLEVGPGTFRPLDDNAVSQHVMHSERFEIPAQLAEAVSACRARNGAVWAVGTTVVRALESSANDDGIPTPGHHQTALMITPGFHFRVVDHLITNFHLPRSTLLMLVAAFAGYDRIMTAYQHAVAARYRFYSYGDAMCVL